MNLSLSLLKYLHNGPLQAPCTEPKEVPRWSAPATSPSASCRYTSQLCKRLSSKEEHKTAAHTPPFPKNLTNTHKPLAQPRCGTGLFSTCALQNSWVHVAAAKPQGAGCPHRGSLSKHHSQLRFEAWTTLTWTK